MSSLNTTASTPPPLHPSDPSGNTTAVIAGVGISVAGIAIGCFLVYRFLRSNKNRFAHAAGGDIESTGGGSNASSLDRPPKLVESKHTQDTAAVSARIPSPSSDFSLGASLDIRLEDFVVEPPSAVPVRGSMESCSNVARRSTESLEIQTLQSTSGTATLETIPKKPSISLNNAPSKVVASRLPLETIPPPKSMAPVSGKRLSLILLPENFQSSAPASRNNQQHAVHDGAHQEKKRLDLSFLAKATERRTTTHPNMDTVDQSASHSSLGGSSRFVEVTPAVSSRTSSLSLNLEHHSLPSPKLMQLISPSDDRRRSDMAKRKRVAVQRLKGVEVPDAVRVKSSLRQVVCCDDEEDESSDGEAAAE
ncbi:hypothetical protein BJ741DRAFT_597052 [Chytriomyces cf. hyalinus JEL632]|nr:hypothetical protein BJ741DRAFT_597052 [Chytriomyces cf. hyalinus JEL632]